MNTAQSNERPMSVEQRKMIFALYRECGIGEELRHDVQHGVAGKTSLIDFTSCDAARLIEHLQYRHFTGKSAAATQSLTSSPEKAGATGKPSGSAPAPITPSLGRGGNRASRHGRIAVPTNIHKLPSPEQLAVLEHLYKFAGYETLEAQRAFVGRIVRRPGKAKPQCSGAESAAHEPGRESAEAEKHPRPRSMWEAEELIFALVAQAAPKMLEAITAPGFSARLTPFEQAFMFTNCVKFDLRGTMIPGTFNNARVELEEYLRNKNKRGRRTMPRFSLTKFFEIVGKYK